MNMMEDIYQKGLHAYYDGDHIKSIRIFRDIMDQTESDSIYYISARYNVACNLMDLPERTSNQLEEALQLFQLGVEIEHLGSIYYLAVYYEWQNDTRAIPLYTQAAKKDHQPSIDALIDLGITNIN